MIRIAICDDEKNIRTYLSSLVRKQNIECEITEYASTDEYLSDQKEHDLLFLDIEMKSVASGMDGMSMAKQIRATELTKQPIIIFVTGYEKYVYDAFDVGAFQYLLKPIDEQRFAQVFRRAAEQIISEAEQQKKTLVIQYANTSKAIPLDHIYYLESQSHKVVIHMNEEELEYYAKLGDLEEELQGQFFRIHKGYLVNLASISNKSKEEMTMDEYKQWVMNEMSQMPVSAWVRSTYSSGATVIKEEAFERMKSDPEYENYVLNRVRSAYSVSSLPAGSNNVSYDVIGASPEECYGYAGPVGNSSSNISGNEKSWWEKRHEKMEELLAEQEKEALKRAQARRAQAQENFLQSQLESRQRLQSFFMEKMQNEQGTVNMSAFQSASVSASAVSAYEDTISTFSKSVIESQKL